MAFLFGRSKQKTSQELVKAVKEAIPRLDIPVEKKRAQEEINKCLASMKIILIGNGETAPQADQIAQLAQEIYASDLLLTLCANLWRLEFDARKDYTSIFTTLLRRQIGSRYPTVDYLQTREDIVVTLIKGYENVDIALSCGTVLRECIRNDVLAKLVLSTESFWLFFEYVQTPVFDIAGDAFATFKDLLTRHRDMVAGFLSDNYDRFFSTYEGLLHSANYVTKRQSLKLLSDILLERENFVVMKKYVESSDNLKIMMNLLRDKSRNIQFESFHVFKVFVANPHKTKPVHDILLKNKEKLMTFLSNFQNDRKDDEQFKDEKQFLIRNIDQL